MTSLLFAGGAYCRAAGTRSAFGAASDQLVREGYPPITIVSGDREYADQVAIFLLRYVQAGDIRGRRVYDVRYWNGVAWYRISADGTVAVPGTSNHESRRAADLGYPYNNRNTAAHRRLQQIAALYGLKWTGVNFDEDWHWEFLGVLGQIAQAGIAAGTVGGFLMELSGVEQREMYNALKQGGSFTTNQIINVLRTEIAPAIAAIALGGISYPGEPKWNVFQTLVNVVREDDGREMPQLDNEQIAASLAPTLAATVAANLGKLSDDTLKAIAKASADEQDRRERERLTAVAQ